MKEEQKPKPLPKPCTDVLTRYKIRWWWPFKQRKPPTERK